MANSLLIEKQTGGYFKFTLNGDTANAITSIQNDLLAVGNQLHFKTGNGANIIKEQFIYPEDVTIVSGGTFTFTTVAQVWDKLIDIDYFAWLGGGGGIGIDRFDDLVDTFKYTGNAGKTVIVDNSELRLVPVTLYNKRLFTELEDTPDSLVPNKMVVVNSAGDALILKDQPEAPETLLNSVGYFDYNDLATQTTPLSAVANVALKLTNDTEGANTSTDQNPYGVSYVWDYTNNQFNFNELEVGDTIDVRIHVQVTTTTSNQRVLLSAKFGIGSVSEFTNIIYENQFKSAGLHEINFVAPFYMGSNYITDNPAELYLTSDASATVKVDGWYVRILRKNINIITVDYQVEDSTTSVKGIVRLAGDLGGTANSPTVPELANKVPTSRTIGTTSPLLGGGALSSNLSLSIQPANSVDSGYLSYVDWGRFDEAHKDRITSAAVTGTSTKTLTLNQHDGGTVTASWTDNNTGVWGGISGTLSSQTDLQNALDSKVPNSRTITINGVSWNLSSDISFTAGVWGAITGTLSSQTDLQAALDLKANDASVVKLTGDQDISGKKSFNLVQTGYDLSLITSDIYDDGFISSNNGMLRLVNNTTDADLFRLESDGAVFAKSFIKKNGTSSQFLKADGTVDSNTYATTSQLHNAVTIGTEANGLSLSTQVLSLALASTSVNGALSSTDWNTFNSKQSALSGTGFVKISGSTISYDNSTYALDNAVVKTSTNQVIQGKKDFNLVYSGLNLSLITSDISSGGDNGMLRLYDNTTFNDLFVLESDGAVYAKSFVKSGGTSSQYLMADGSVSTGSGGTVTGTGTTNYIPKFTGASAIGNSLIFDNGTNVGIGTTTPSEKLEVQNGTAGAKIKVSNTGGGYAMLECSSNATSTATLSFTNSLALTGGNVGIGTTSPAEKLSVVGGNISLGAGYKLQYSSTAYMTPENNVSGAEIATGGILTIKTGGTTERVRVDASGKVGIGTTSPQGILDIRQANKVFDGYGNLNIFTTDTGTQNVGGSIALGGDSFGGTTPYPFAKIQGIKEGGSAWMGSLIFGTTASNSAVTEKMRITSGGNVGIGTTSPSQKLHIGGVGSAIAFDTTGATGTSIIQTVEDYKLSLKSNRGGTTEIKIGDSNLEFLTNGSERMRITSGGNVLIGTTTDAGYKLDVNGSSRFQGYLNTNNSFEKVFSEAISFPNGTANLAADVRLGNVSFWGYIEVEVNSTYSNQNATGKLTKVFAVGTNPGNLIYTNEARVVDSMGTISDNIAIGDFSWDSTNSTYRIPISHIVSSGNVFTVKVRMFTSESGAKRVFDGMSIGSNYTLTALARQYVYYNGNVGIGTISPEVKLDVRGSLLVDAFNAGNENGIFFRAGFATSIKYNISILAYDHGGGGASPDGISINGYDGVSICTGSNSRNERMRVTETGNVLIGTTTDAGYKLDVNGNVRATGFFNSSDNRLKDLTDYDYNVSDIKPITYLWKDGRDNKKHVGYSAQEVQKVMPDAVNEDEKGFLSVNYVEVLVAKIAELENRIKQLEK